MKLVYEGKTKDVYALEDGNYLFKLKDDATGANGVFDPGANTVGLTIKGLGLKSLELSAFFFKKLEERGINTHFISSDMKNATMTVKPALKFGNGLEVICRLKAAGSFLRRYGEYAQNGQDLNRLVEFTLKDDAREDPPATKDTLVTLGIMTEDEFEALKASAREIAGIMRDILAAKGLDLYDIKYEFGKVDGRVVLMDEISAGNMRVFHNGRYIEPMELNELILG